MNLYFIRVNYTILATAAIANILNTLISLPTSAADSVNTQKIAQIAKNTSVQINAEGDLTPGGSGVIIAKQGNIYTVLTANHVVCDDLGRAGKITCATDTTYSVRTNTGKDYPVKDVNVLQKTKNDADLALATFVAKEDYPIATLGNSDQMIEGSDVFVGGFPAVFGKVGAARDFAFTTGMVVSRASKGVNGYSLIYDAKTITGNSGGPVFDIAGRVVAIHGLADTSAKNKTETGAVVTQKTGFNAGIPINTFLATNEPSVTNIPMKKDDSPTGKPANNLNNPQTAKDFYARGITKLDQYNYREAAEDFTQAIKLDPKYIEAYFKRGYSYTWVSKHQEALTDFNQAIVLDPNYLDAYLNRGWSQLFLQNDQAALEDFNRAIRLNPNYADAYAHQGMAYIKLGKYQAALESSKQAIRLDPRNSYGYTIQADVLNNLKDYPAAIKVATLGILIDPDDFNAYINRAIAYTLTGNFQNALSDYQKASEIFARRYIKNSASPAELQPKPSSNSPAEPQPKPSSNSPAEPQPKPSSNSSSDPNVDLIKSWQVINVPCNSGGKVVSIVIDGKKYCVLPHPSLMSNGYQYNRATGKLEPVDANLELIRSWELTDVSCNSGEKVVSITIDKNKYCVLPHPSLMSNGYRYNRRTGKLEPVSPN
ncbi:tetratricopeptide repeat-containing serine protease family protein [Dolichospermum planctonicum CS-1226]|uniref:Tetratricopeptide repeat-containing serine protease family protein n=1 Tax=Dolichospermum planctonicum CS-1226 TaxID=3021751 RepID=A0ABT5AIY2_9CYAN|nr:tetratricopeptide repeat-containing serine protease family protein [Dolichospermum planctonicum]MDB9537266.1 tetratricopeptide repeat-containing serine protease family protein [Dolichospermum planctonicum CS-1226]